MVVSNIGTWMQRTAQDWLVLTQLTHNNATALGIVIALQFGPQLLLLPLTGFVADHYERRIVLVATQACMGLLALCLGLLTISGYVQLWHVYVFALLLGCVSAFDSPARQTFVSELVGEEHVSNAVALNSTSFNSARMIGPAIAGLLIAALGSGWVFLINALSFAAVIGSLLLLRGHELHRSPRAERKRGSLAEGFHYVQHRPDLQAVIVMTSVVAAFGMNFNIFISTMSVTVFRAGASQYGLLTSTMAVGSVIGALLAARREKPQITLLFCAALVFGLGLALAAIMPNAWLFGVVLLVVGISAQSLGTTAASGVQTWTEPAMRGRVMALFLGIALGSTPLGSPLIGWVADTFGPRWGIGIGALSGLVAALIVLRYLVRYRGFCVRIEAGRLRIHVDPEIVPATA